VRLGGLPDQDPARCPVPPPGPPLRRAPQPAGEKESGRRRRHTLLLIIYGILDRHLPYDELGEDFYTRREDPERYKDKLIARLTRLGYTVTVQPAQAA